MRAENIVTEPVKASYKVGVYSTLTMCGFFIAAFVLWSIASFGGALLKLLGIEH